MNSAHVTTAIFVVLFCNAAIAEVTRAGPANADCSELMGLTYDDEVAKQSVVWAEGYWTAFNIVLADSCMYQRDLTELDSDRNVAWKLLKAFCSRFDRYDLQAAAYGVLMIQPVAVVRSKPQCEK
ncbi:hypothetical protein [uncultured Jannaschia sp.]|uniref:hypothetical protein n=1 Tax=uncultured Jannaschia sp. TaxID=293347 RepID=UPI00262074B4|nr:hypothetical protein [uncultured Jannaschia sp.]